jgi:hypothetical protein
MKRNDIKVGKKYMLSLGRRGAVSVEVSGVMFQNPVTYLVRDSNGSQHHATARKLSPCPVTDASGKFLYNAHEAV